MSKNLKSKMLKEVSNDMIRERDNFDRKRKIARSPVVRKKLVALEKFLGDKSFYAAVYSDYMYVSVAVQDLDGFAESEPLLTFLEEAVKVIGADVDKVSSSDYPTGNYRTFEMVVGEDSDKLKLVINAYLKDGAQNCRRVVKSSRQETIYEYSFECGEENESSVD